MPNYELGQHRGKYVLVWYDESGKRNRRSLGTADPTAARQRLEQIKYGNSILDQQTEKTVGDLYQRYQQSFELEGREVSKRISIAWVSLSKEFSSLFPHHITDDRISDWTKKRLTQVSKGTVHIELGYLRAALKWAVKKNHLKVAPFIQLPSKPAPKLDYLTRKQFQEILPQAGPHHIQLFLVLGITTGARSNALFDLTWSRVDLDKRLISLSNPEKSSTSKGRAVVPINDTAYRYLLEAQKGARSDYVIEWVGHPIKSVRKALTSLSAKTGIKITPHMLRHSAAVWMAEGGTPMSEISQYLGHSSTTVTERVYARFSPDYLRKAASNLELE